MVSHIHFTIYFWRSIHRNIQWILLWYPKLLNGRIKYRYSSMKLRRTAEFCCLLVDPVCPFSSLFCLSKACFPSGKIRCKLGDDLENKPHKQVVIFYEIKLWRFRSKLIMVRSHIVRFKIWKIKFLLCFRTLVTELPVHNFCTVVLLNSPRKVIWGKKISQH